MPWAISCAATSQLTWVEAIDCSKMKTTSFSSVWQLFDIEATPPTDEPSPSMPGVPEITASMCCEVPGSTSVTITSNCLNWFCTQATKVDQAAALLLHGGIVTVLGGMLEEFARESSGPRL